MDRFTDLCQMIGRMYSHFQTAKKLVEQYKGKTPFHLFLKAYFKENKKHGSKDRKTISHFCYCYFRMGKAMTSLSIEEKMIAGIYLCTNELIPAWSELFPKNWDLNLSVMEKISFLEKEIPVFHFSEIFPFEKELSESIETAAFVSSFFTQPKVFVRIRPDRNEKVMTALKNADLKYEIVDKQVIAFPSQTNIQNVLSLNQDVVLQDWNSQKVATLFPAANGISSIWDCCAASGGKTIALRDAFPKAAIDCSDVRPSILHNLESRLSEAKVKNVRTYQMDLQKQINSNKYDFVLLDAPCSGSGTWGRTPENISFTTVEEIEHYQKLQFQIAKNVATAVKKSGYLLYVTCSVFSKENESNIENLCEICELDVVEQKYFLGYTDAADSLFACLLKKRS